MLDKRGWLLDRNLNFNIYCSSLELCTKVKPFYPQCLIFNEKTITSKKDFLIIDNEDLKNADIKHLPDLSIILFSPQINDDQLALFFENTGQGHISQINDLQSLFCEYSDFISLDSNKLSLEQIQRLKSGANERWAYLQPIFNKVDFSEYFSHIEDNLLLIGEELLSNLVFHNENEHAIFSILQSHSGLVLQFVQNTGSNALIDSKKSFISALQTKRPKFETKGAGLGLYLTYKNCNVLTITKKQDSTLEVRATIHKNKRYKDFRANKTSVFFLEDN